jgi:outer membrane protein OmpA-like peptidoglycan-associated protein
MGQASACDGPPESLSRAIGPTALNPRPVSAAALALLVSAVLVGCLLMGCGTRGTTQGGPSDGNTGSSAERAAGAAVIKVERQWLESWFKDTPVRIVSPSPTTLEVEVPREFSFDPSRQAVKPPLAAVLDKLAESLRRNPQLRVDGLAAPGDTANPQRSDRALAIRRAGQVQTHLRQRGVASTRVSSATVSDSPVVSLRLTSVPP